MSPDSFPVARETDRRGSMMEVPIAAEFREPLIAFWQAIFGTSFAEIRPIMSGDERAVLRDIFWSIWSDDRPQATCHLTIDLRRPILGGLGEVATAEPSRGRGLASDLCQQAKSTFLKQGGLALFLGTVNPAAERVYQRLGWQSISGSHVMVLLKDHSSPAEFFGDYFRRNGVRAMDQRQPPPVDETPIGISVIDASERVAMIPLILYPHSEFLLDANLNLYSTQYVAQKSCMGLFSKYSSSRSQNRGVGFAAHDSDGKTVGLATAVCDAANGAQIDGFVHPHFPGAWDPLIQACLSWCKPQHRRCRAEVARRDAEKLAKFERLGFRATSPQSAKCQSGQDTESPAPDRISMLHF